MIATAVRHRREDMFNETHPSHPDAAAVICVICKMVTAVLSMSRNHRWSEMMLQIVAEALFGREVGGSQIPPL